MKTRFVIINTPTKLPLQSTILYTFLLHYFEANLLLWGVFISIYFFYWAAVIKLKLHEKQIDLKLDENNQMKTVNKCENCLKSSWVEKLKNIQNEH